MLNTTQNQTLAKTFFDYLLSPEAADILMRYGYRTTMAESSN
jgi:ABC-type molybdate transport system substrate-binding protein